MGRRLHAVLLAGLLASSASGCAWTFQKGPTGWSGGRCDPYPRSPYLDIGFAGLAVARAAVFAYVDHPLLNQGRTVAIVTSAVWVAIHAASSLWGFLSAAKCRELRDNAVNAPDDLDARGPPAHRAGWRALAITDRSP